LGALRNLSLMPVLLYLLPLRVLVTVFSFGGECGLGG
jgi:hypothetical protein